jgi:hypothetical protein
MAHASKVIERLEQERGWNANGVAAAKKIGGFWFAVQHGGGTPILVSASLGGLQPIHLEKIKQLADQLRKQRLISQFLQTGQTFSFVIQTVFSVDKNLDRIDQVTQMLADEFRQMELGSVCGFCGAPDPTTPVRIGDKAAVACPSCLEQLQQRASQTRDQNETRGNYLTGLIGALLGALVGAALWVLVSRLGYYAAIVGLVMAFLAQAGYRLFKGRIQKGMPVIVILSVVLGLLVATAANIAIDLMQDPDIALSLAEALRYAPQAFYNSELFYVGQVWKEVGIGLFFALLGSYGTLRRLFREVKGETYEVVPF